MTTTITLGGQNLTAEPLQFSVVDVSRPMMPTPRHDVAEYGISDGEYLSGGALGGISFSVTIATMANDTEERTARLDALRALLNPRIDQSFLCSRWSDRYWMVRPVGAFAMEELGPHGCILDLELRASDPLAFSVAEFTTMVAISSDYQEITIPLESVEKGTGLIRPVIEATLPVRLPGEDQMSPIIEAGIKNLQTGERLSWRATQGQIRGVKFDSEKYRLLVHHGGAWMTPSHGIKRGPFITLLPRMQNTIAIEGLDESVVTVKFRERFK